jgi:putative ABC transport system ATP-binding protein
VVEAVVEATVEPAAAPPLLELRGVTKVYGEGEAAVHALRGVDLAIQRGEFVAILGTSGCGKSTAMNMLGCLDAPTAGEYRIEGVSVGALPADVLAALRNRRFGFIFQGFNLLSRTSAIDNVELPLIYAGVPRRERLQRAREALALVGLAGRESARSTQLSGGEQQRVAIARALVTGPSLLLADEPTGNLDTARKHEIMRLLVGLNRERGITVVMVTHEPDMAAYGSRVVEFRDGRVVKDEPTSAQAVTA